MPGRNCAKRTLTSDDPVVVPSRQEAESVLCELPCGGGREEESLESVARSGLPAIESHCRLASQVWSPGAPGPASS